VFSRNAKIEVLTNLTKKMTKPKTLKEKDPSRPQGGGAQQQGAPSHGTGCVQALLERHRIPRHGQAPAVAEALGMSLQHGYRLVKGESAWSFELLEKLGEHFGETLVDVLSVGLPDHSTPALLVLDQTRVPCRIRLDDRATEAPAGALVAERVGPDWVVSVHKQRGRFAGKLVRRLLVQPPAALWHVAVLDDDKPSADNLVTVLNENGFDAEAFYSEAHLREAMARAPFDAYLLDWIVGVGDARKLVEDIRESSAECPIAVMTGEFDTGRAAENDVRDVTKQHGLFAVVEKPFRNVLLAAQLTQAFEAR